MKKLLQKIINKIGDGAGGFTMIELLVVIAVIGVLAVALLSALNPIEQINKGRDTRTRTDMSNLLSAAERYYAVQETYPWNDASSTYTPTVTDPDAQFPFEAEGVGDWDWVDILVDSSEVKQGFTNRLKQDDVIYLFKESGANGTLYGCFKPRSQAFRIEAANSCQDDPTHRLTIGSTTTCVTTDGTPDEDNYICLP